MVSLGKRASCGQFGGKRVFCSQSGERELPVVSLGSK